MVIFRFADSPELQIECSASVFPKILEDVILPSCPLHSGNPSSDSSVRKKRSQEEYFIDFTVDSIENSDSAYKDL